MALFFSHGCWLWFIQRNPSQPHCHCTLLPMASMGSVPKCLESPECRALSPITKQCPGGTYLNISEYATENRNDIGEVYPNNLC